MKRIALLITTTLFSVVLLKAQQGIGVTNPDASSALEISSTTKGLLMPRMTTAQMNAISSPANGLQVYNITDGCVYIYRTSAWLSTCSATYAMAWGLLGNSSTNISTNFIGTTDNIGLAFRTNNIERLRITEGGNVGIGTTTPSDKLHVVGDFRIVGSGGGYFKSWGETDIEYDGGVDGLMSFRNNFIGGSTRFLGENTSSSIEIMRLKNDGTVGIGNRTPQYKLDIDAREGSSGNPLRLQGLNAGATSDSIISSNAGVLRRLSINQVLGNAWNILGNSGTVDGTNFIGTTDNVPFNIRVNNRKAGRIDNATDNTFFGYEAGNVTTGLRNTFLGGSAGLNNTTGQENTAIGHLAFNSNTTGQDNVAVGQDALRLNTMGSTNTAVGESALESNTIGVKNVAVGSDALNRNTAASDNLAFGYQALYNQSFSNAGTAWETDNIAMGTFALVNNQPTNNTNGYRNIGIGRKTLEQNTTGASNIAIGYESGRANTTGSNNTLLGYNTNVSSANLTNATAIGANAVVGASNSLVLGDLVNVGINTRTPQYKLDIDASTGSSGNPLRLLGLNAGATSDSIVSSNAGILRRLSINQVLGNAWNILGNSGTNATTNFIGTTDAVDFVTKTSNAERMRVLSNGNVGIGTPLPSNLLTVSGATNSLASGTLASFNGSTNATASNQVTLQGGLTVNPSGATVNLSMAGVFGTINGAGVNLGNISFKAVHGEVYYTGLNTATNMSGVAGNIYNISTGTITNAAGLHALGSINSGGGTITNNYGLLVENQTVGTNNYGIYITGAATRALHVNSGISYFGGNVGIGTTTPAQQLTITAAMQMPSTFSSTTGVIYKGGERFIHNYTSSGNFGNNTFIGINAGNFTMSSPTNWLASGNTGVGTNALRAITEGGYNSALGFGALTANTTGSYNAGFGTNALAANTTGTGNTAIGNGALQVNTTANSNTTVGNGSLALNTTGAANSALGESALGKNTTGNQNTGVGQSALRDNTTGNNNVALGLSALQASTTASNNVAVGTSSLVNNLTGANNVAVGGSALSSTTSSNNVSVGYQAGTGTSSGGNNTFVGYETGITNITGANNTLLGYQANVSNNALTNATAIGNGATVDVSNKIRLGNTSVTNVETYGSFTTISDRRLKTNINNSFIGLDFIKAVRPVQYELITQKGVVYDGFVAQEIDSILTKQGIKNFSGLSRPLETQNSKLKTQNTEGGYYTVSYSTFVVPLVNAVKELDALSDKLKVNSDKLAAENAALKAELERMKKDNAGLKASVDKNSQDIEVIKAALSKKQN